MIRVVKLTFKETHIDDFKSLFEARKERIKKTKGCIHLELWQDTKNPSIFYTFSIWNQSRDLEIYRMSTLFQDTWSTVKQWFSEKPEAFSADKLVGG